jgi:hypothetical protein
VHELTFVFTALVFFSATQGACGPYIFLPELSSTLQILLLMVLVIFRPLITTDIVSGWALTLLSQENLSYASTCQTIGLNTGFFASFTVFLALNSEAFA